MSADIRRGRFAPSPTGRMHLGNVYAALMSWLEVKSQGGLWVLRHEDLDPQRSRPEFARQIEDDLRWLGLDWDEGGLENRGDRGPYVQSLRGEIYRKYLDRLTDMGLTYPCTCTRADIMATQAPHQSDGRVIYAGTCRPARFGGHGPSHPDRPAATRIYIPEHTVEFEDLICGPRKVELSAHCGDFVLRRADGAWAYQLAVVVDDALMGITDVVRGNDLLLSAAQQIYLFETLGFEAPRYAHLPLLTDTEGRRLSKRDRSLEMGELRLRHTPESLLGHIAKMAGLRDTSAPVSPADLLGDFNFDALRRPGIVCA